MRAAALPRLALGALPILALIGLWHATAASGRISAALLPPPSAVFARFLAQLGSPVFLEHAGVTLLRLFTGFTVAALLGVGLGLAMAVSGRTDAVLRPLVRVLAPIPKVALYPAFILTLGFAHGSKIALVIADALFPILLATASGARLVEPKLVWSARAMGTPPWRIVDRILLPAALPSILTGCRIGLVVACIVVFLAEMITSTDGLGHLLVRAARSFQTVDMFVPLIAISLLGLLLNAGLGALRKWLLRGYPNEG